MADGDRRTFECTKNASHIAEVPDGKTVPKKCPVVVRGTPCTGKFVQTAGPGINSAKNPTPQTVERLVQRPRREPRVVPPKGGAIEVRELPGQVGEYRLNAKRVVVPGDRVKIGPSRPGKRDGYDATVVAIFADDGKVNRVDVKGAPKGKPPIKRSIFPERILSKYNAPKGEK